MKLVPIILWLLFATSGGNTAEASGTKAADKTASQYDLTIKLLSEHRRIEVTGTMRLPAADAAREKIEFFLWARMNDLTVQILEPKISAPVTKLEHEGASGDRKWIVTPTSPIPAGESVLLWFSYISDGKPAPQFNISPEGSFAGGGGELWYPQVAFKQRDIGILRFIVPVGEIAISNGVMQSSQEQKAKGEFVFRVAQASKFGFASGKYTLTRRTGKVAFSLYLLRPREHSQKILDGSARALDFLTNLFGDFPYGEFSLVEVKFPTIVAGLSEFGFILADSSKLDDFDLAYWAHEMGHQWWGNLISSASNTPGRMMLSEGVTQFGALMAVEAIEGQSSAERFRRNGYHGKGQSAALYFKLVRSGTDFPLTSHIPKNQEETLNLHKLANSKGFILLDMLARRIGREKFKIILRRFVQRKANQTTSWQEFQRAIEAEAGQDIHWFFEQWFERTGAPDYKLDWKQSGKRVRGSITQPAPYYRTTLEIEVVGRRQRLIKTVEAVAERVEFNWNIPFKVKSIVLDPHYKVLRWTPEFHAQLAH